MTTCRSTPRGGEAIARRPATCVEVVESTSGSTARSLGKLDLLCADGEVPASATLMGWYASRGPADAAQRCRHGRTACRRQPAFACDNARQHCPKGDGGTDEGPAAPRGFRDDTRRVGPSRRACRRCGSVGHMTSVWPWRSARGRGSLQAMTSRKDRRSRVHALSVALTCLPGCGALATPATGAAARRPAPARTPQLPRRTPASPMGGHPTAAPMTWEARAMPAWARSRSPRAIGDRAASPWTPRTSTGSPGHGDEDPHWWQRYDPRFRARMTRSILPSMLRAFIGRSSALRRAEPARAL